jgi:hypothetical protein
MNIWMTLRWWWARLTRRTIAPQQAFAFGALVLEAMHITRQLLRSPGVPVSDAERQWWREHFGPPDGYVDSDGKPSYVHTNQIDRQWRDRWGRLSPEAQAARWAGWERRGLVTRTSLGTYQATAGSGVTVLQEMWEAERT